MSGDYTKKHFDLTGIHGLLSPRKQLHLSGVALGIIGFQPDEGYTFTHRHREQEEVYMVIEGSGVILLDGELVNIGKGDFVRVSSHVKRALRAGGEGMTVICAGGVPSGYPRNPNARYLIDDGEPFYDDIPPWYAGDEGVMEKNELLKMRMKKKRGEWSDD